MHTAMGKLQKARGDDRGRENRRKMVLTTPRNTVRTWRPIRGSASPACTPLAFIGLCLFLLNAKTVQCILVALTMKLEQKADEAICNPIGALKTF